MQGRHAAGVKEGTHDEVNNEEIRTDTMKLILS